MSDLFFDSGPENAAVSPRDRMKAKMQERAKKKTAEKYTIDQLLEKVMDSDLLEGAQPC